MALPNVRFLMAMGSEDIAWGSDLIGLGRTWRK